MSASPDQITFIQWAGPPSGSDGTIQVVALSGDSPNERTTTQTEPITVITTGSTVEIRGSTSAPEFGTIDGHGALHLNIPQSDGTLEPGVFQRRLVADFNTAIRNLEGAVTTANEQYTQAAQIAATNLTASCVAAGGSYDPQQPACTIDGGADAVDNAGTPNATFHVPLDRITAVVASCQKAGGRWTYDKFGGYVLGNSGYSCVFNGFEDALLSASSSQWAVPIDKAAAVSTLMGECTAASGSFGLDTTQQDTVFGCLEGGTSWNDIALDPAPHYQRSL
jgi:hypothetical protein